MHDLCADIEGPAWTERRVPTSPCAREQRDLVRCEEFVLHGWRAPPGLGYMIKNAQCQLWSVIARFSEATRSLPCLNAYSIGVEICTGTMFTSVFGVFLQGASSDNDPFVLSTCTILFTPAIRNTSTSPPMNHPSLVYFLGENTLTDLPNKIFYCGSS